MLASFIQIKEEGNLPDTIKDEKLKPHAVKAEIEIKKILTSAKYAEIEAKGSNDDDFTTVAIAEANLALSYAVTSLNIETHGSGIVRSKGFDESRSDLLSQNEVERLREYYRTVAMDLLRPFIPQVESTEEEPSDIVRNANYTMVAL